MLKKILLGSAAVVALATFMFGREAVSYVRAGINNVRGVVKSEIPLEFEIERAKTLVDQLVPDIRNCMHVIAEQQVDIEHLNDAIAKKESGLQKQKGSILAMRADLGTGKNTFVYASRTFSSNDVKQDLANRFSRYKAAEEVLTADRHILSAREQTLAANTEKLDNLMKTKKELEVKLEQLQARLQTVRAAESVSKLAIDDSNLSHARKLIDDLNKQLDVKQRVLEAQEKFVGTIPVEQHEDATPTDLAEQIDTYFQTDVKVDSPEVATR